MCDRVPNGRQGGGYGDGVVWSGNLFCAYPGDSMLPVGSWLEGGRIPRARGADESGSVSAPPPPVPRARPRCPRRGDPWSWSVCYLPYLYLMINGHRSATKITFFICIASAVCRLSLLFVAFNPALFESFRWPVGGIRMDLSLLVVESRKGICRYHLSASSARYSEATMTWTLWDLCLKVVHLGYNYLQMHHLGAFSTFINVHSALSIWIQRILDQLFV